MDTGRDRNMPRDEERHRRYSRRYYREHKAEVYEYQKARRLEMYDERILHAFNYLGGPQCIDCGYEEDIRALEFDHVPEYGIKRATIASRLGSSWKWLKEELDKCEVVCANCHAIRTANRRHPC